MSTQIAALEAHQPHIRLHRTSEQMHLDFLRIRYYVVRGYEPHCLGTSEVAASRAQVVEIFYGDPDAVLVRTVHDSGALASWQVSSAAEAWAAVEAGCDFVVAQGTEAGGHVRGRLGLLALLPEVLGAVEVPVLAAGGVGTARGVAAALAAGADGVRVGTRFVAATESGAHPEYVAALLEASSEDTVLTETFWVQWSGAPTGCCVPVWRRPRRSMGTPLVRSPTVRASFLCLGSPPSRPTG